MAIKVGDKLPDAIFAIILQGDHVSKIISSICSKQTVLFLFVPGAYNPTCEQQIRDYIKHHDTIIEHGINRIVVVSVNDHYVMNAWAESLGAPDEMYFLNDPEAQFVKRLGLDIDLSEHELGVRSKRCSMIVEDSIVTRLNIEPDPSQITVSGADNIIDHLRAERSSTPASQQSYACCSENGE